MHRYAHSMAKTMAETVAIAGIDNHLAGGAVNFGSGDAGTDGGQAGQHGPAHHPVTFDKGLVRLAGDKGPGHVGAVALIDKSHIDEHQVSCLQLAVGRDGVRSGRVGAEGDDGFKAGALCPHFTHGQIKSKGDFPLGHARFDGRIDRLKDLLVQPG